MPRLTFNYDSLLISGPLTDRRIHHYAKLGFYGSVAQKQALRNTKRDKVHNERKTESKTKREAYLDSLLADL